jgi:hypothetical protein
VLPEKKPPAGMPFQDKLALRGGCNLAKLRRSMLRPYKWTAARSFERIWDETGHQVEFYVHHLRGEFVLQVLIHAHEASRDRIRGTP